MIINFIKSDQNNLSIKIFIVKTLKLLISSNQNNSQSLNRNTNSKSFLLLTKSITKTIQDEITKNIKKEINSILVSFKMKIK